MKRMNIQPMKATIGKINLPSRNPQFDNASNSPEFPGQQSGATVKQVQQFIKDQLRVKGYSVTVDTGTTPQQVRLSGDARLLCGIAFVVDPARLAANTLPEQVTLTVNNEIVIEQIAPKFLLKDFTEDQYYAFPRPLSGTDDIVLTFTSAQAVQNVGVVFYYI